MKNTKFQKLNSFFKNNYVSPVNSVDLNKQYSSKEELGAAKLQKQQQSYLNRAWQKIAPNVISQSLYTEAQRLPLYIDYERMEEYPLIGAALDIVSEEVCTLGDDNRVLNISSNSERIKTELEDLFYNVLNVQSNSHMWARDLAKYGDNFLFLKLDDEMGVIDVEQLPISEIERVESNRFSTIYGHNRNDLDDGEYYFQWKATSTVQFKSWQVAHFRLLTGNKRLPYGQSVLEKARRIWKNLILVEDAMRSLVITRGVDRKAFYINVGNINDNDVESYMNDIAARFKRTKHVDSETGQQDLKYHVMAYDDDYFIPIRNNNDGTRIQDVAGQSNFNIEPIEYDLNLLLSSLLIPKTFLNFNESVGEGKNLSMMDIRFAKRNKRIQQALLFEFNKIAMIHLYLKGYTEDLGNFSLSMNNPSIQEEIMKIDLLQTQLDLYKEAVSDAGNGMAAMSMTNAKQKILGMTADEIIHDLEQQRLERSAANELEMTPQIIPNSGIFNRVDSIYGDPTIDKDEVIKQLSSGEDGLELDAGGGGGGGSLGGIGGDDVEFGSEDLSGGEDEPNLDINIDSGEDDSEPPESNIPQENQHKYTDVEKLLLEIDQLLKK